MTVEDLQAARRTGDERKIRKAKEELKEAKEEVKEAKEEVKEAEEEVQEKVDRDETALANELASIGKPEGLDAGVQLFKLNQSLTGDIMAAEMETRLRDSVLRVLRPTLAQDLLAKVQDQAEQIGKVDGLESNVVKQGQYTKILEDAVMTTSNQVRDLESITGKQFVELKPRSQGQHRKERTKAS
eukprot:Skav207714  [mRNA]  locus=scaffold1347:117467:126187:+ [translate_table: standard]